VEFAAGVTGTFSLAGTAARPNRTVHVVGTVGEIAGVLEDGELTVRRFGDASMPSTDTFVSERIAVGGTDDSHGGGDQRLVADFVRTVHGEPASISCTSIDDSLHGHLLVYAAEQARRTRAWVDVADVAGQR